MAIEIHEDVEVPNASIEETDEVLVDAGSETPEVDEVQQPEGESTDDTPTSDDDVGDTPDDKSTDTEVEPLMFNGAEVDVDIPEDITEQFAKHDINAKELVADLYSGDEFSLSEENHEKLSSIYGKTIVDSYISAIKGQNEMAENALAGQKAAQDTANENVWNETVEQVGGEDKWDELEGWAGKSLSDEQFNDFNSVMETGSRYAQKLAVADMMSRRNSVEGDDSPSLVEGENGNKGGATDALSRAEYLQLHTTGEYAKNPSKFDAMRRIGQTRGL